MIQLQSRVCFHSKKLFVILGIVLTISCSQDEETNLTLGDEFIDISTYITQTDTFSIEMSTVIVDSLITSNTGVILAGYCDDGELGKITTEGYSKIILPPETYIDIESEDRFDSLTLVLPYNTYSYGDTNIYQELDVFLLAEEMLRTGESFSFYNNESISYQSNSIGHIRYLPRPNRDSLIEIRIDDELGEALFYKLLYNAEEIQNNDNFQQYIYGIAIVPNKNQNSCIIGFDQSGIALNLYTSRISSDSDEEAEQDEYVFESYTYYFSSICSDRSSTDLDDINTQSESLNSSYTRDKSYIQGGTGVLTKIEFPHLNSIMFDQNKLIFSATLWVGIDINSYDKDFPESLVLYETDENNSFDIQYESKILSSSEFYLDEKYHLDTYYTFDITSFLKEQIESGVVNNRNLLITIPSPEFNTTLNTTYLDASGSTESKTKLIISYIEI